MKFVWEKLWAIGLEDSADIMEAKSYLRTNIKKSI